MLRLTPRLQLLALIVLVLVLALPVLTYPLGRDQGEFATIGYGLLDGRPPYSGLWNPKPPAVFVVYALFSGLFGPSVWALRLIDLVMFPALAVALYMLGARLHRPATGLLAVVGMGPFYFTESFWTLTQNDGIALLPMALAALFALKTLEDEHPGRWAALSGAMAALVIWFKYPFALFALALIIVQITNRWRDWSSLRRDAAAFTLGGGVMLGGGVLLLVASGAFDAMLESIRVTSAYTRLGFQNLFDTAPWRQALTDRWTQWGILLPPLLAGMIALWPRQLRHNPVLRVIVAWLIAGVAILLVQAKGYDYHWLPMLPPALLLAAYSVTVLLAKLPGRLRELSFTALVTVLLFFQFSGIWLTHLEYLSGRQDRLAYYDGFRGGEYVAGESQRMVDYLRQRTTPGESLFIYGFRAEVYYLAELRPATRFIFNFPLIGTWYPAAWQDENVAALWANPPPYALILQGDFMPWVTGRDADSHLLLQEDTELNNWLMFNYERVEQIGNFLVWQRRDG